MAAQCDGARRRDPIIVVFREISEQSLLQAPQQPTGTLKERTPGTPSELKVKVLKVCNAHEDRSISASWGVTIPGSRSVAYASASGRRATVYREDCATPSPFRWCQLRKKAAAAEVGRLGVWTNPGRIM